MRKRIAVFFIIAVMICTTLALTACGGLYDKYKKNISDWRDVVLMGSGGGYTVRVISGERESDFSLDGVSGDKTEYTVFTVSADKLPESVALDVSFGDESYSLLLDKHPLGETFSAEVASRFTGDTLDMSVNGEAVTATTVTPDIRITGENALEIAKSTIDLDAAGEIYVRIIENPVISDGCYYWYVAVYTAENGTKAVLIDISTGEILAERK